jgi:hypothetical protein
MPDSQRLDGGTLAAIETNFLGEAADGLNNFCPFNRYASIACWANSHEASAQTLTHSQIEERTIECRAIEAANWGMPVVNFDRMVNHELRQAVLI